MDELIAKHNPWWKGQEDITIKRFESMKTRWFPKWIRQISTEPFSLNFVIGPRQVGKSTGIKILIHELLKKNVAESIFYFNCDFIPDIESFKKIMDTYLDFRKTQNIKSSYIFLDEVTSLPEWWRIIKGYIDLGVFENDILTITGSSSLKLRGDAELFPGRRGKGKNITVYPLSFREFLDVKGIKIETTGDIEKDMKSLLKNEDEILRLFSDFIKTGGFPLSINEDQTAEEQFIAGFEGEILKSKKSMHLTKAVISSIIRKSPSPLSFSTIGKDIGVSYNTVQDYVETLKNLYIIDQAFYGNEKKIIWRKERKFFFLDPFIARTFALWSGEKYLDSAFYEWLAQSHLLRRFGSIFYFRNSFEIDCIAGGLKVEIKVSKPHRKYPKDVLILNLKTMPLFLSTVL